MAKLSVIIVNYNTRALLQGCLKSIRVHEPRAQVIVVDNASRDDSVAVVERQFPEAQLLRADRNLGFAAANNLGAKAALGDYLALVNSDAELQDDTLSRCVAYLGENPGTGALSPRLIGLDGQPQQCLYPWPTLASIAKSMGYLPRWLRSASPHAWGRGESNLTQPPPPGWLAGTTLVIRRSAWEDLNRDDLLDSRFFMYWEDADLSARLSRRGWSLEVFEPGEVLHHGGASGGGPDSIRRLDLYAWYMWGRHQWFQTHRPWWEAGGLWCLDALDVVRKAMRGLVRDGRKHELKQAMTLANVLARRVVGLTPPRP